MPHLFFNSIRKAIKHWYLPLLVGLFFIVVSIIVFTSPMTSFVALALLFSISFLLSGIAEMIFALTNKDQLRNWGWALGFGIITTLVGVLLILDTELSMSVQIGRASCRERVWTSVRGGGSRQNRRRRVTGPNGTERE